MIPFLTSCRHSNVPITQFFLAKLSVWMWENDGFTAHMLSFDGKVLRRNTFSLTVLLRMVTNPIIWTILGG